MVGQIKRIDKISRGEKGMASEMEHNLSENFMSYF